MGMVRPGRRAVLEQFAADGLTVMFGNPGTVEQGFLDELADFGAIRYVLALQEACAVGMADGYAAATGSVRPNAASNRPARRSAWAWTGQPRPGSSGLTMTGGPCCPAMSMTVTPPGDRARRLWPGGPARAIASHGRTGPASDALVTLSEYHLTQSDVSCMSAVPAQDVRPGRAGAHRCGLRQSRRGGGGPRLGGGRSRPERQLPGAAAGPGWPAAG